MTPVEMAFWEWMNEEYEYDPPMCRWRHRSCVSSKGEPIFVDCPPFGITDKELCERLAECKTFPGMVQSQ